MAPQLPLSSPVKATKGKRNPPAHLRLKATAEVPTENLTQKKRTYDNQSPALNSPQTPTPRALKNPRLQNSLMMPPPSPGFMNVPSHREHS
jgi:hypothetical protein